MTDRIAEYVSSRAMFPLTNFLMNRRGIIPAYRGLLQTEHVSAAELADLQLQRLLGVISHAARYVPWYRRRFAAIGLDPRDIRCLDDLKRVPPLTRQEVIDYHREMVDERQQRALEVALSSRRDAGQPIPFAVFRRHRLVRNNSSGSTGAPTVFFEDGSVTAMNWALEMRLKNWYGVAPCAREARMVRLSTTYRSGARDNRLRQYLWRQLILPGVNLRDADYEFCLSRLNEYCPKVLWGFTGALTGLAGYLKRVGRRLDFAPAVAVGWAAPVYFHEQTLLEEVFQCPASNIYGSREIGHIALKCPHGRFHVNQEYVLLETDGAGELLATTLVPTVMPFFRYRMGDIARLGASPCSCGRTLQVLEEFVGRTGEIFTTRDGRMIPPNFWCRLFMAREIPQAVKRFQVMYTRDRDIVVRIARDRAYNAATEEYLNRVMLDNFSPATAFRIDYVDDIEAEISGKYQMVYSEQPNCEEAI